MSGCPLMRTITPIRALRAKMTSTLCPTRTGSSVLYHGVHSNLSGRRT